MQFSHLVSAPFKNQRLFNKTPVLGMRSPLVSGWPDSRPQNIHLLLLPLVAHKRWKVSSYC